ncbi:hypothetical protein SDC9_200905 [bioreactor metagenome]|uniref:Uncharacterized protein n=1 Tax=bioreactor metagenome TaxID=1076179 RepID=A0A645IPI9_9ZZZZ
MGLENASGGGEIGLLKIVESHCRRGSGEVFGQHIAEVAVHSGAAAECHGGEGVAVIGVLDGKEPGAMAIAFGVKILQRHFHGHLAGHTAGVGEKYLVQPVWYQFDQFCREFDRRIVGKAAEHGVRHDVQLAFDGVDDLPATVAVGHCPPA